MGQLIVVIGGSRSGKSAYAEQWVKRYLDKQFANTDGCDHVEQHGKVFYIATGCHTDQEFSERVMRHRQRRPKTWTTVEEPCELPQILKEITVCQVGKTVCLIDGIGTWVANLMYNKHIDTEDACRGYVEDLIDSCREISAVVVVVADEVGMDVVPEHKEGRIFRDLNGRANQLLAAAASEVYFVVSGIPVKIKGEKERDIDEG